MADYAHEETEKKLAELSSIIREVYNDAANDMQKTVDDYFASYEKRAEYQHSLVDKGEITEAQYRQWEVNQMGRGERYKDMQSKLAERYTNANEVAIAYVNDMTPSVYTLNANYAAYEIETAGTGADFTLWDEATVRRQIVDHPDNMPYYPEAKAVARGFDIAYGKSQITSTITSAILQGKSIPAIANDLQDRLKKMNRTSAMRAARTAMTEAQNAGRLATYEAAEAMGIHVKKRWIASHDERTREWHAMADGQTVDYKEPFHVGPDTMMYPADPSGRPENVYNCRCTIVAEIASIDKIEPPIDESYKKWEDEKKADDKKAKALVNKLKKSKIEYNEPKKLDKELTSDEIAKKLAGGDQTGGSCASLTLAYTANKGGLDVLDFRGGASQAFFSDTDIFKNIANMDGVEAIVTKGSNETAQANKLLNKMEIGQDYILVAGRHASVVRETEGGHQYLELQSAHDERNGWQYMRSDTLQTRFKTEKHESGYGGVKTTQILINVDSLKDNPNLAQIVGYINTNKGSEMKGASGHER